MTQSKSASAAPKKETAPESSRQALYSRPEFRELPVALAARLGHGRARILALRKLEPGAIVELETPVGEPSRLIAAGAVIGAGEIVEVKGQLALRLTRLGRDRG